MKKIFVLVIVFSFFFTACDKGKKVEPDPPPVAKIATMTVKFGPLPEGSSGFSVKQIAFLDENKVGFTHNLRDNFKYPKFTYKFTEEQVKKYLGKKVYLYFDSCRNLSPYDCWFMEEYILINPLKEGSNEIYIEIPGSDVRYD